MRTPRIATLIAFTSLLLPVSARADVVADWNAIVARCVFGPPNPAGRPGPTGVVDTALIHAAIHDAVQAIQGRFESYKYENKARLGVGTPAAAAAAAAYRMLIGMYGAGQACLAGVTDPAVTYLGDPGLEAGYEAAAVLLQHKRPPFPSPIDPFGGGLGPGEWRPTPGVTVGANTYMAYTEPFTLNRPRQFRPEPPPPLTSQRYRRDYDEVKAYGSLTGSLRSAEQTDLARFWTAFPTQWLAAIRGIAVRDLTDVGDSARLFALVAFAAADSQIAVYESKYLYNFWRPITAIQEGDHDGNPNTTGDPGWTPFLVTPPYPDYTSGANCMTGSITGMLALFFGTDQIDFEVQNTVGGVVVTRSYSRLSDAAQEVVDVRILQGIHFRFADEAGRQQGQRVAHWAFQRFLRPLPGK